MQPETPPSGNGDLRSPPARRRRPRTRHFTLLRTLPHDSPVHRLWAGTKLVSVAALGTVLSLRPSWAVIGLLAAFVVFVGLLARIPAGAIPRPPRWFWITFALGGLLTLLSGGSPVLHVAGKAIGLGGVELFARFTAFGAVLLGASAMVGWTTPLAEIAPALSRLGRPLRWIRLPVDEWALAVSLCVRSLPLLFEEMRVLLAARRLRPRSGERRGNWGVALASEPVDLLTAALSSALRRGGELAQAIEGRGGVGVLTARGSPRRVDAVALFGVAVVVACAFVLPA